MYRTIFTRPPLASTKEEHDVSIASSHRCSRFQDATRSLGSRRQRKGLAPWRASWAFGGVVMVDGPFHSCDARRKRVEDGVLAPLPGAFREDPLDSVHPGCRGGRDVKGPQLFNPGGGRQASGYFDTYPCCLTPPPWAHRRPSPPSDPRKKSFQGSIPMRRPIRRPPITRTEDDRTRRTAIATHPSTRQKPVWRARIILALGDGCGPTATLRRTGMSRSTPIPVHHPAPSGPRPGRGGGWSLAGRHPATGPDAGPCSHRPGPHRPRHGATAAPPQPLDPRFLTRVGPWPPRSAASPSPPCTPSGAAMAGAPRGQDPNLTIIAGVANDPRFGPESLRVRGP